MSADLMMRTGFERLVKNCLHRMHQNLSRRWAKSILVASDADAVVNSRHLDVNARFLLKMTVRTHSLPSNSKPTHDLAWAQVVRTLAPVAAGVALGVVCGGLLALATLDLVLRGPDQLDLNLLNQFFLGYRVSVGGIFIGLLWGAGVGFALGYGFALAHNTAVWIWLTVVRSKAEMAHYSDFLDHL
jgi:hypothetical protein